MALLIVSRLRAFSCSRNPEGTRCKLKRHQQFHWRQPRSNDSKKSSKRVITTRINDACPESPSWTYFPPSFPPPFLSQPYPRILYKVGTYMRFVVDDLLRNDTREIWLFGHPQPSRPLFSSLIQDRTMLQRIDNTRSHALVRSSLPRN
jgi:hypothetical protein